jgi:sugar diacid utilization regulator
VEGRQELYSTATADVRTLLGVKSVRLYEMDSRNQRLQLVAADPPMVDLSVVSATSGPEVLLELLQHQRRPEGVTNRRLQAALGLEQSGERVQAVPVAAGGQHLGVLAAIGGSGRATAEEADELMRATANQLAVALKQMSLIERLTEENIVRDLFAALESGSALEAEARAHRARHDLGPEHIVVHIERSRRGLDGDSWTEITERVELALRRLEPGTLHAATDEQFRALLPLTAGGTERELGALDEEFDGLGRAKRIVVGRSGVVSGAAGAVDGLRQAADAARIAHALHEAGGALAYPRLGAYRYLVHLANRGYRPDPYLDAVRKLVAYDARRGSQLVLTLERYLAERRSATRTARALIVHRNTLRQRLDRIESLSGLDLGNVDLLALELAIKLIRLNPIART